MAVRGTLPTATQNTYVPTCLPRSSRGFASCPPRSLKRKREGCRRTRTRQRQRLAGYTKGPSHPIPCYTMDTIIADDCGLLPTLCGAGPAKPPARLPASPKTKSCPVQYIYRQYLDVPTKPKTISDHRSALSSGTLQSTKGEPTSAIPSHVQAHLAVPSAPSAPFIPSQPVP